MSADGVVLSGRPAGAEVGHVTCVAMPVQNGPGGAGEAAEPRPVMQVTIPVTVRAPESSKGRLSLGVTALLRSPRGWPVPVARAPSPGAEYLDASRTATGSAGITAGIAHVQGGVERPLVRQELAADVAGAATRRLDWLIPGGRRQLAGSHEFLFMVDRAASRYAWLEVTAELRENRNVLHRRAGQGGGAHVVVPLIADDAPQAGATLLLYEGETEPEDQFFAGRPLDLPLAAGSVGIIVTSGRGAAGSIRWSDDVGGRPGFLWAQTSSVPVVRGGDEAPIAAGRSVWLEPGTMLWFGAGSRLVVVYDADSRPDWAVIPTLPSVLEVDIVIDGQVTAHQTTASDYVTVGRSHRDICIDRADISRSHGVLELKGSSWTYRHQSAGQAACLRRGGSVVAQVGQQDVVRVEPGDVIELTGTVSLALR